MLSEFLVEARSGGTCVVRVVTSAFGTGADWEDEFVEEMEQNWKPMFDHLSVYLAHFAGQHATTLQLATQVLGSVEHARAALDGALAVGLRHPEVFGAMLCASPGGGYRPSGVMTGSIPRAYLVAGTQEPFFRENAKRWAVALADVGAEVVMTEREGSHGGAFWQEEFPRMVAWAFKE